MLWATSKTNKPKTPLGFGLLRSRVVCWLLKHARAVVDEDEEAASSNRQGELRSAAYAKSGGRRSHGAWGLLTARQRQRGAEKIARHSPRCPTGSRNSTERREDVHSKRHYDVDVQGAVKPARAIARGEASPGGLSRCADLENVLQETTSFGTQSQTR